MATSIPDFGALLHLSLPESIVGDLSKLHGLSRLHSLDLEECSILSLDPLAHCSLLTSLRVSCRT